MNKSHSLPQTEPKDSFWFRLDARLKLVFCLGMLLAVLLSYNGRFPLLAAVWCGLVLRSTGISTKSILKRLAFPLLLALMVFLLKLFTYGLNPWFSFYSITAYREGFYQGGLIALRMLAGVSLILFLTLTTSTPQLLRATQWLGLPPILLDLACLTYSYIFLFHQIATRTYEAQQARLGYVGLRRSLQTLASLIGLIFIRAYDQTQHTYQAMLARGYRGRLAWPSENGSRLKLIRESVTLSLWIGGLYTLSIVLV